MAALGQKRKLIPLKCTARESTFVSDLSPAMSKVQTGAEDEETILDVCFPLYGRHVGLNLRATPAVAGIQEESLRC